MCVFMCASCTQCVPVFVWAVYMLLYVCTCVLFVLCYELKHVCTCICVSGYTYVCVYMVLILKAVLLVLPCTAAPPATLLQCLM